MKIDRNWEKEFRKEFLRLLVTPIDDSFIEQEVYFWREYPDNVSALEAAADSAWLYIGGEESAQVQSW